MLFYLQRAVGNIIGNPHGKMVLRAGLPQVVKNRLGHGRGELLRAEAVAPADYQGSPARFHEDGADILVERFAQSARLLGPVKHGDALAALRQRRQEMLPGERPVETDFHQAHFLSPGAEVIDGLFYGIRG